MTMTIRDMIRDELSKMLAETGQVAVYDRALKILGATPVSVGYDDDGTLHLDCRWDGTGEMRARSFRGQLVRAHDNAATPEPLVVRGANVSGGVGTNVEVRGGTGSSAVNHGFIEIKNVLQLGSLLYAEIPTNVMAEGGGIAFILDADVSGWGEVVSGGGPTGPGLGRLSWFNGSDWTVVA